MALKLLETEFIKDARSANPHYQTRLRLRVCFYSNLAVSVLGVRYL
jgi:hypothetical protein